MVAMVPLRDGRVGKHWSSLPAAADKSPQRLILVGKAGVTAWPRRLCCRGEGRGGRGEQPVLTETSNQASR